MQRLVALFVAAVLSVVGLTLTAAPASAGLIRAVTAPATTTWGGATVSVFTKSTTSNDHVWSVKDNSVNGRCVKIQYYAFGTWNDLWQARTCNSSASGIWVGSVDLRQWRLYEETSGRRATMY